MKKLLAFVVVFFAVAIGLAKYSSQHSQKPSGLLALNIEAMAYGHSGEGDDGKIDCATKTSGEQYGEYLTHVTYCAECKPLLSRVGTKLDSTCQP